MMDNDKFSRKKILPTNFTADNYDIIKGSDNIISNNEEYLMHKQKLNSTDIKENYLQKELLIRRNK